MFALRSSAADIDGAVGCESRFPTVTVEIRLAASGDEQLIQAATAGVFDHIPRADLTTEFLRDPRHHLVIAIADGRIVGFVSAVHYVHPDKPAGAPEPKPSVLFEFDLTAGDANVLDRAST